jgi:hypothetical protein
MTPSTLETIKAFGISGIPKLLPGGRGLCYVVGETVFRPSDGDNEAQRISELVNKILLHSPTSYRLAKPQAVVKQPNNFVFNGWTASSFLLGSTEPRGGDFEEIPSASRAFHADIAELVCENPDEIAERSNRWCEADKVTWGEKKLEDVQDIDEEILAYLNPVLESYF